jgi:two-component system chemotaxis response regulator CheB
VLERALAHGGDVEVVGVCTTAEEAIAALPSLRPDLLTLDIELPGMSGLEAIEQVMAGQPLPILVISAHTTRGSETAAAALAAGALETVPKDDLDLVDPDGGSAASLRERVKLLSRARVIRHPRARLNGSGKRARPEAAAGRASVIALCASTGGPQALSSVLGSLPAEFPLPILVVQHIAAGFTEGLARWLDASVPPPVRVAEDGAHATAGVWIAPEDAHLLLGPRGRLSLEHETIVGYHRPSADVLLHSLAEQVGAEAVGVVLTGMGKDGAEGVEKLRRAGGLAIAQDEASSAIYGMPKAAAERGAQSLPLAEIPAALMALVPTPLRRRA